MNVIPPSIKRVIEEFNKLPGIGHKTSERFVFHLLRKDASEIEALAASLRMLKESIQLCMECYTYTEKPLCAICANTERDHQLVCVVAEPKDVIAVEKTHEFGGVYHVLGGVIDHIIGMGPQELRINELAERVQQKGVSEVIVATNPDMEGETTALLIAKKLEPFPVVVTRIARGLPVGADIEFADEVTLGNALTGRRSMKI